MRIATAITAMLLSGGIISPAAAQEDPEFVAFQQHIMAKLQQYQQTATMDSFGALSGLWQVKSNDDTGSSDLIHIIHLEDVVVESSVNRQTGELSATGFAEARGNGWAGWFSLACKRCCPGVSWWNKGNLSRLAVGGIHFYADSKTMDQSRCVLTEAPDIVEFDMSLMNFGNFVEIAPGKLIHIVAAPAVGNQPAQYKAAVKYGWNITQVGVAAVDLAIRGPNGGSMAVNRSTRLSDRYEMVTDRSGLYQFLFIGYNAAGQPLHLEIESITIPRIPGIN